jgi:hypothetical protein
MEESKTMELMKFICEYGYIISTKKLEDYLMLLYELLAEEFGPLRKVPLDELPLEMRYEIYNNLEEHDLDKLAHTSKSMRYEIKSYLRRSRSKDKDFELSYDVIM